MSERPDATIIRFPSRSRKKAGPDAVRLGYDFGFWCAEFFAGDRFVRRQIGDSLPAVLREIARVESEGLRRLPPSTPAIEKGGDR